MAVTEAANIVGVSRVDLFRFLRDADGREPWLYVRPGTVDERPYRTRIRSEELVTRLVKITRSGGRVEQIPQPLITPKGRDTILAEYPVWAAEQERKREEAERAEVREPRLDGI